MTPTNPTPAAPMTSLQKSVAKFNAAKCDALSDPLPALRAAAEKALAAWDAEDEPDDWCYEQRLDAALAALRAINSQGK